MYVKPERELGDAVKTGDEEHKLIDELLFLGVGADAEKSAKF
jgi:hypothetical protein